MGAGSWNHSARELMTALRQSECTTFRSANSTFSRAALAYADRFNLAVFPCRPHGKEPLTEHGHKDASRAPATIQGWWKRWPNANVGAATGMVSATVAVDIDPRNGGDDSLARLEAEHGNLPDTPTSLTGGGGTQHFFRYPAGADIRCSAGVIAPGIDIKANGGYVIAPPSIHPSGNRYRWEVSARIDEVEMAPLPEWLLALIMRTTQREGSASTADPDLAKLALGVPEGERDVQLFRLACYLRRLGYCRQQAEPLLTAAAERCRPPFPRRAALGKWRWL